MSVFTPSFREPCQTAAQKFEGHPLVGCDSASCVVLNRPSPFSSLPVEIMHLIFDFGSDLQPSRKGELPFTFTVSQVDRRWRMIAFDTASLWTRIVITPQMPSFYIAQFLQRSNLKSHRLHIQLNFKDLKDGEASIAAQMLSYVTPYSPYWGHLSIISSSWMVIKSATEMLENLVLPHLQSLYISEIGECSCVGLPFLAVPVTTLRLDGVGLDISTFPLSGITSLHLEDYRIHDPANLISDANVFREMPQLQNLILMGSVLDIEDLEDVSNINLPFLSFLRISDTDIAFTFMDIVSAPSLRSLVLSSIPNEFAVERTTRYRSIRLEFPFIHSLTITDTFLDIDSYTLMFHSFFPGLTHLAVLDSDVEPIFNLLSTASIPLLPCLHTLTLSSLPMPLLRPLIVDRCVRGGRPLHTLNLTSSLIAELHADGLLRWLENWLVDVNVFHEDALVNVPWTPLPVRRRRQRQL